MKHLLLISACALIALPGAALAQGSGWGHGGEGGGGRGGAGLGHGAGHSAGPRFSAGASVARFGAGDLSAWRGGHWFHGAFGGTYGWWWWADGFWYWYPAPVYPYPDVVADTYVPDEDYQGPPQPAGPVWYYCHSPAGYYPYVRACPTGWETVPATPPDYQMAPAAPPPPSPPGNGPPPVQGPPPQ